MILRLILELMRGIRLDDAPPSATEEVARLRLELRDVSLRELESSEFVRWDKDEWLVKKGKRFYEQWDELY